MTDRFVDLLVDLSDLESDPQPYVRCLRDVLGPDARIQVLTRAGDALPEGVTACDCATPGLALASAMTLAGASGRHLAVLFGDVLPESGLLAGLCALFAHDPLFGAVQPRFAQAATDGIWPLPPLKAGTPPLPMPRETLKRLPDALITPEVLAACTILRQEIVANIAPGDVPFTTLAGALRFFLSQARRRGFRTLVSNRLVLPSALPFKKVYPVMPESDAMLSGDLQSDMVMADDWLRALPVQALEPVAAAASATERRTLLLDCRGMMDIHNGTSHSMLHFLDGFQKAGTDWDITVLAAPPAIAFHGLRERYPALQLANTPSGAYAAAVGLNQPWGLGTVRDLHRHALMIFCNILDTIAWDIIFPCPAETEMTWNFVAEHADGLLFNSHFTEQRFNMRFPIAEGVARLVTHHSFSIAENTMPQLHGTPPGDYILVFGNDYDHKDVEPTLLLLREFFPFRRIVAFGVKHSAAHAVETMASGYLAQEDLERLVGSAGVVVFPSFYEGFGMPTIKALAYGRAVVARASTLLEEIAAVSQLPGQLAMFHDPASLGEQVARALAGNLTNVVPQAGGLQPGEEPVDWAACAARILRLIQNRLPQTGHARWLRRENALRAAGM